MNKQVDVTIALVNYKTPHQLIACLRSLYRFTKGITFEVVVVDNASGDESVDLVRQKFPNVGIIVNNSNTYATGGNNQVLKKARGRYCLVLNPDITFINNSLFQMVTFLDAHQKVGAVTCQMILPSRCVDHVCTRPLTPWYEFFASCILVKYFPANGLLSWYRYGDWQRDWPREVETISDIIMLARTKVLKLVGYYDENISLFFMEDDLSRKIYKAGFSLWFLSSARVKHSKGASTKTFLPKEMYEIYERDMLYFYKKYYGFGWWLFLRVMFLSNRLYYFLTK